MILQVFSVFDSKTQAFLSPFQLQTLPEALRAIGDCCNNPEHAFGKHPEDYTLFQLGSWNDATGLYELHATPMSRALGVELVHPQE